MNDPELRIHVHDALCRVADLVLFRYNPCLRTEAGCVNGEECCEAHGGYVRRPGQHECIFLGPHGCTTRNLGCKLYLCDKARERTDPLVLETFRLLDELGRLYDITTMRPHDAT